MLSLKRTFSSCIFADTYKYMSCHIVVTLVCTLVAGSLLKSSLKQTPWVTPQAISFANCEKQSCTTSLHTSHQNYTLLGYR